MLVLMLMSMIMSRALVDFFVLSCAYSYVASEDQAFLLSYFKTLNSGYTKAC